MFPPMTIYFLARWSVVDLALPPLLDDDWCAAAATGILLVATNASIALDCDEKMRKMIARVASILEGDLDGQM